MNGIEVRRPSDDELVGYVRADGSRWQALAVFGGLIGVRQSEAEARALVLADGLAATARRWFLRRRGDPEWEVVVLQEARPGWARGVIGLYALPGAEPLAISAADLEEGDEMTLEPPPGMEQFASR